MFTLQLVIWFFFSVLTSSFSFLPLLQRFQASFLDHMSVEVCAVLPELKLTLVLIRPRRAEGAGAQPAEALTEGGRRDLAYVLHTSGTTGLPKIVRVPHQCILPNIVHLRSAFVSLKPL